MTFTNITNRIYFLADTNSVAFPIADLTASANAALNHVSSLILMSDLRWRWDDSNQTDLPIATAALVANQQDYSISSTHLIIERIEVKDSDGNWHLLNPIDQSELKRDKFQAMGEYQETSGIPAEYDLIGESIFLYPKPNYSQAASLKVYYARGPHEFSTTDTTEEPGFNSLFHDLIPLTVSYEYVFNKRNNPQRAQWLLTEVQKGEDAIQKFYGKRFNDKRPRFTLSTDSNK